MVSSAALHDERFQLPTSEARYYSNSPLLYKQLANATQTKLTFRSFFVKLSLLLVSVSLLGLRVLVQAIRCWQRAGSVIFELRADLVRSTNITTAAAWGVSSGPPAKVAGIVHLAQHISGLSTMSAGKVMRRCPQKKHIKRINKTIKRTIQMMRKYDSSASDKRW